MAKIDTSALDTLIQNTAQAELPIVAGFVCAVLFVKFNQKENQNKANHWIGMSIAATLFALALFRIYKGF